MHPVRLPSIRRRVTRTLLLISLLWGLLVTAVVWAVLEHEIDELMDHHLRISAEVLHSVLAPAHQQGADTRLPKSESEYEEHLIWQVIDTRTGQVQSRSERAPPQALLHTLEKSPRASPDGQWRVITLGFRKDPSHFLLVGQSAKERQGARDEAVAYTLIGALLMGALATLVLHLLVGRELRPLAALSSAVKRYDPLRPETAPQAPHRAELEPMAQAITELGQRLSLRIMSERAFTAHAAHALRTPLAGIDAQLAVALKEAPAGLQPRLLRTREAAHRLSRVMQALLTMFRSGSEPKRQKVNLAHLLQPWTCDTLHIALGDIPPLDVDPDLLAAVMMNLLDNARQHGATQVQITSFTTGDGQQHLRLHDDGTGCTEEVLARLRQALHNNDYSPASGLKGMGLMLADLVMHAHGGKVTLPAADPGFCIELNWPAHANVAPNNTPSSVPTHA